MITQTFDLNLIPEQAPVVVHCDQYDKGTGRLIVKLYEGDVAYTPTGTAVIQGCKPDGHGFNYSAALSGNTVTADLTEQMSAVSGRVRCQIVVTEMTGRTGTFVFILDVQPSALPSNAEMSDSEYQIIEQAIEDTQQAAQDAEDAAEDAEAWAVGERGGVPVGPTDPTYHNNSYYWSQQAAAIGDLDDLNDVTISSATNGQVLTYDSNDSEWKNASLDIDDLGDVNISSLTDGQILKYDSVSQKWKNANESGGGASDLNDLTDVSISSPTDGQVLKYDGNSGEWVNASGGGTGDYMGLYGMTEIQSSDGQGTTLVDLNNYTTVGNYFCDAKAAINLNSYSYVGSSTTGSSTRNNAVFLLYVRKISDTYLMQDMFIKLGNLKYTAHYYRHATLSGGTWSFETYWHRVIETGQTDSSNSGIELSHGSVSDVLISSATEGDAFIYDYNANKWKNKPINKVTSLQVSLTGWTADTTSQSGTTLYKKQISLNNVYVESPTVDIGSSGVLPTTAEQESYNLLQYATVDDTVPCLYLYASAIPTTAFYIKVKGVD